MNYLNIELNGIDENGNEKNYKLADFKGKNTIVYFYPEDDTPVCTKEAQEFRDSENILKDFARIIGVSSSDINSHKEFQKNHKLNFILLSDIENKLKKTFEEQNQYITNIHRATFILDKEGKIIKYWGKVDVENHMKEIADYFGKE
ncbi:MAG: peroxiredoxin [Candidatus Gastranaerophilales bacterium]|nr:peroxiredoxin [Candidatus Gastranaerophilales bacterium]